MIDKATLASIEKARAEYLASLKPKRPGNDWFTKEEYAEASGIAPKCAHLRLQAMFNAGSFDKQRVGRRVYWRVKP